MNPGFKDQQAHIFPSLGLQGPTGRDRVLLVQDTKARLSSLLLLDPKGQSLRSIPPLLICPRSHVTVFCTSTSFSHSLSPRPRLSSHHAPNTPEFTPTPAATPTPLTEYLWAWFGEIPISPAHCPCQCFLDEAWNSAAIRGTGWSCVLRSQSDESPQLGGNTFFCVKLGHKLWLL